MPLNLQVTPEVLISAAAELDALAGQLYAAVISTGPALDVLPAGNDEVSLFAASYFRDVWLNFNPAAGRAFAELTEAAEILRNQASGYQEGDLVFGAALNAGV